MRKLSQKLLGGSALFTAASILVPVLAQAQTYRYDYDYSAGDAAAGAAFGGTMLAVYVCVCCISLIVPIICAVIVYKDAQKNNVENAILWTVISFFFPLIGLLVYFLAIKPEAVKKNGGLNATVSNVASKIEEKVEEVKDDMNK